MPAKPSFTSAQLTDDDTVRVHGFSDISDPPGNDILDIRVVLTQQATEGDPPRIVSGSVAELSGEWQAELSSEGFAKGDAVAFGVETRRTNSKTITWVEPIEIE